MESTPSPSPWFTLGNLTLLRYLYQFKPPPGVPMSKQTARSFRYFRLGRYLMYFNLVLHVFRIAYLHYHLASGGTLLDQQPYAPLMTLLLENFNFFFTDSVTQIILGTTVAIFFNAVDYLLCFKTDHQVLHLLHNLMVDNGQHLLTLNRRRLGEKPKFNWRKPGHFLRQWSALIQSIWNSKNLRFRQSKLEQVPNISRQLRARLAVYSTAIDKICYSVNLFIVLISIITEVSFLTMAYHRTHLPPLTWLLLIFDSTFLLYSNWNAIRIGLFDVHLPLVVAFLTRHHIDHLNRRLLQVYKRHHHYRYQYLNYFYSEYFRLKSYAEHANTVLVSPLLAILFLSITSLSVVVLSVLLFKPLHPSEQLFMSFFFGVCVLLPLFGCLALIGWSRSFYSSEPVLYRMQSMLTGGGTAKIKLLVFYEQLCTKSPFYFTAGPFGHISKQALYEFAYFYSGMVMYVSDMIRTEQMPTEQSN